MRRAIFRDAAHDFTVGERVVVRVLSETNWDE